MYTQEEKGGRRNIKKEEHHAKPLADEMVITTATQESEETLFFLKQPIKTATVIYCGYIYTHRGGGDSAWNRQGGRGGYL